MIDKINRDRAPSVELFCELFENSERTVLDDIRFLKERVGMKIEFDRSRGGYVNTAPAQKLPKFELTEGELFALTLGKDMLTEYGGTTFEPVLEAAIEKISERLPDRLQIELAELSGAVRFKASGVAPITRKAFFDFSQAADAKNVVQITYYSAHNGQLSIRQIEPYRIVENRGAWYVVAWCKLRAETRTFALHRIRDYEVLSEKYENRAGVDVEAYLDKAFQLEHGDPEQKFVIKFDPIASRYIRERKWHHSQELVEHGDATCTLSFTATRVDEVKRWVLTYGASAEVVEPAELRDLLAEEFEKGLGIYRRSGQVLPHSKPTKKVAAKNVKDGSISSNLYCADGEDDQLRIPFVAED